MLRDDQIVFIIVALPLMVLTLALFRINFFLGLILSVLCLGFWITFLGSLGVLG